MFIFTRVLFREEKEWKIIIIIAFICSIINCNKINNCKVMKRSTGMKEERR